MFHALFFFNDTATTEIYTLSLHDALPISGRDAVPRRLAGALADLDLGRRQLRLVAAAVVLPQGRRRAVRLHLAARHAAPAALRPVHRSEERRVGKEGRSRWLPYH